VRGAVRGLIDEAEYAANVERALRVLGGDIEELERDLETRMRRASEGQGVARRALRDRLRRCAARSSARESSPPRAPSATCWPWRAGDRVPRPPPVHPAREAAESRAYSLRSQPGRGVPARRADDALRRRARAPARGRVPPTPAEGELLSELFSGSQIVVARGGERARQLDLARENAVLELARAEAAREGGGEAEAALAHLVGLDRGNEEDEGPLVIDGFDVSNFQGANVVASRVRFRGGHPDRSGYRRYRIRGVRGQDDFQSMHEVVGRSLRRGLDEGELPDLVVIDGGPAQLASALAAREDAGAWDVRIVALAKARAERLVRRKSKAASDERLFLAPEAEPLALERHSPARHLLERIRDEAHRFAITYHRKERGKLRSRLDSIAGVGPVKRKALLARFGSVRGVQAASLEELAQVPGISSELARAILDSLRKE
jgi:excinuclease UvrABC nuclease subunit